MALPADRNARGPVNPCAFALRDGQMAGLRFGAGEGADPSLIFLHATGFNARTYRIVLEPMCMQGDVLAVDLRGHGRSALPALTRGYSSWNGHARDVVELLDQHISGPIVLAGHSMGAVVALLAAAQRPQRVRALCLIEPVILPPWFYRLAKVPGTSFARRNWGPMRNVAKRRAFFASVEEAERRLTGRGVFASFPAEALRDYLADGLRPFGTGLRLSCEPNYEAATFAAQAHAPFAALNTYRGPIHVLRAQRGSTFLDVSVSIVAVRRPDISIKTVAGTSHMLPLEQPSIARAALSVGIHQSLAR